MKRFVIYFILWFSILFFVNNVNCQEISGMIPLWTYSEDERIFLHVIEGEQVGFSRVYVYLEINESIRINNDKYRFNKEGFYYFDYEGNETLDIHYRGINGRILVDENIKIGEREDDYIDMGLFLLKKKAPEEYGLYVVVGIIAGGILGIRAKKRSFIQ